MTTPLLTTKLYIPPVRPRERVVPRPHLIERLNAGLHRKLTLISAPAGFGKTTLLCEWAASCEPQVRVAWLSLDDQDNDVARFWTYLIAALQTAHPGLGQDTLKLLQAPQSLPAQAFLTPLLNDITDLALTSSTNGVVVVLDDYHLISAQAIHEGIAFLVEHGPHNMHLAISTRADPPLPTFRLRARGQLTELRSDDLRFAPEEAATFLNQLMGLNLAIEDVKALEARTEGWIVGLQLAALSMQGRSAKATHEFINTFTGGHHYILEYLTEEVVRRQPEPVRRFLVETSILDRLCGPLCDALRRSDALSEQRDGAATLAYLERCNLFIVPLDDEHRWYRFHHLFADLLGNLRRSELPPERIRELHRLASSWHEQNGTPDDAIKHALRALDFEKAATLMEQTIQTTLSSGRVATVLRWCGALPDEILLARPRIRVYQGWALSLSGQPNAAERVLQEAREALSCLPPLPENAALRGTIAAMLTGIATLREEPSTVIQEGREALTYLPEDDLMSRARVCVALGTAYAYSDDTEQAARALHRARELALQGDNPFLAASAMEMLAGMQIYHEGRLQEGARTLQQILELGTAQDGSPLPFTATAHALMGDIHLEWNELDAASVYLEKGIELLQLGGIGYGLVHTYCAKARLRQAVGDEDGAVEALRKAEGALDAWPLRHMVIHLASSQVRVRLALGDVETASQWAEGDPARLKHGATENLPLYLREVHQISLARVLLARGETENALATLEPLQAQAGAAGRAAHVIQIYLFKALAFQAKGNTVTAVELLEQSLSLAEPEGYARLFFDEGEPMINLLQQLALRGHAYAGRLLAAFVSLDGERRAGIPLHSDASVLVEPLTRRELQVLELVCEGYTNQEIAETLVITMSTVKKHAGNIYGKLGVTNRAQAIVETHRLGLLPKSAIE